MVVLPNHGGAAGEETPMSDRISLLVYLAHGRQGVSTVQQQKSKKRCQYQQFVEQLHNKAVRPFFVLHCLLLCFPMVGPNGCPNGFPVAFQ